MVVRVIGPTGSGRSTIGATLARAIAAHFEDADDLLMAAVAIGAAASR